MAGWLNVDVAGSEFDIDLACGALPWIDAQFRAIASQHTIEHLELESELLPLLTELRRVAAPNCEIWLTCPDLERICAEYRGEPGQSPHRRQALETSRRPGEWPTCRRST